MTYLSFVQTMVLFTGSVAACTVRNPNYGLPGGDASIDAPACTEMKSLRCENDTLVRCNGMFEVRDVCPLGCNATELRCGDLTPSNGLAKYLDLSNSQPDLNLGETASINSDTGEVTVGGMLTNAYSDVVLQSGMPSIRVLVARSIIAKDVVVVGKNALAIISRGDITITGVFSASAKKNVAGPGAFNSGSCAGVGYSHNGSAWGGAGGGGFGSPGGTGGTARTGNGLTEGGTRGSATGTNSLVPLRGGCDGGFVATYAGGGGGALQFVSGTRVAVIGRIAANGAGGDGGGSGGGILLEAPVVEVSGHVVANGGGGNAFTGNGGYNAGEDGSLDDTPAKGGSAVANVVSAGGNGAAGDIGAVPGGAFDTQASTFGSGGGGGGGIGRIRVNTTPEGYRIMPTGLYSPMPSIEAPAIR